MEQSGIALVTSNFGGIDAIKAFPRTEGIVSYLFTDMDTLCSANEDAVATWDSVIVPSSDWRRVARLIDISSNRLRAKYFKVRICRLPELQSYRWLAWADASLLFRDAGVLRSQLDRLAALAPNQRLALVPHPERQTVREEHEFLDTQIAAGAQLWAVRYSPQRMAEQMARFAKNGWNVDARLWCGGLFVIENNDLIAECWDEWWTECQFSIMDQLSLGVLLERHGLEPQPIEVNVYHNDLWTWVPHPRLM